MKFIYYLKSQEGVFAWVRTMRKATWAHAHWVPRDRAVVRERSLTVCEEDRQKGNAANCVVFEIVIKTWCFSPILNVQLQNMLFPDERELSVTGCEERKLSTINKMWGVSPWECEEGREESRGNANPENKECKKAIRRRKNKSDNFRNFHLHH